MSLSDRPQHQLRRIEGALHRSDPHLAAMLALFCRLYEGQGMPAWEQAFLRQSRFRRAAAWIAATFAAAAAGITVLLRKAAGVVTSAGRTRARPPAAKPERA